MKREDLDQRVKAAFQFKLETVVEYLELQHGDAQEFKSVKKAIMIGDNPAHRWVDPPEKAAYIKLLKETLRQFMVDFGSQDPALAESANELFDPIITAYYAASRAKAPVKGKLKETIRE